MLTRCCSNLVLVVVLAAGRPGVDSLTAPNARAPIVGVSFAKPVDPGYKVYQDVSTTDAQTQPTGGALAGGGTDVDAGMVWLMGQGGTRSPASTSSSPYTLSVSNGVVSSSTASIY